MTSRAQAQEILRRFDMLDRHLVSRGFPPTSAWWRKTIERWYLSGKKQIVIRAGRRAGKSSTLCRLGVIEAIYGQHDVPPGDIGVVAVVSARRSDALERLRTIAAILDALGMPYTPKQDTIELQGLARAFNVYTASIAGVSGFTGIFIICDEVAKWRDSDTGSNPATEVIRSVRPTLATQKNAKMALSSSPMGLLDAHADAFALGETDLQTTAYATTWDANPTVTEEETRELEPDEVIWAREYKAVPQAEAETSLLNESTLVRHQRSELTLPKDDRHRYVATMDPATRGNAWTFAITTLSDDRVRKVVFTHEWVGTKQKPLKAGDVFREMKPMLDAYGLRHVYSDQWNEDTLRELAALHGIFLIVDPPWSAGTKADAYEGLKTLAKEGLFQIGPDVAVRSDLLGIRQRITRAGLVYDLAVSGSRHSDFAPTIAMGVMLAVTPPKVVASKIDPKDHAEKIKREFLLAREKERQRKAKFGRLPPTHR